MNWLLPKRRGSLYAVTLRSAAKNAVNHNLIARQKEAAASLPVNSVRRLILENPDTFVQTGHIEEGELPIG